MEGPKEPTDSRSATLNSSPVPSLRDEKNTQAHADANQHTQDRTDAELASDIEDEKLGALGKVIPQAHPIDVDVREAHAEHDQANGLEKIRTSDPDSEYPHGTKLALITLALCLSVFLMALDNTIIATAIPKITDEFSSITDIGWYASAYLLTTAAFQLLFGKFYSFFSIKWVYLVAIGIFELGSLICAVAPNSTALIVGRAIAGVGSAGIFSGALIIVSRTVPLVKRPVYTGVIGAMYGVASVAGPLLGGVFTDKATWRWCFYINLPIGAITVVVIAIFFKAPGRAADATLTWKQRIDQLDVKGTAVFMPAIICLLLALQWGGSLYAWNSWRIIMLFVFSAVLISIFIFVQWKAGDKATVPFSIIRNRTVWSSSLFAFCLGSAFFIVIYFIPIWFQAIKGDSAVDSGIHSLPLILGLVIISIVAGAGVTILGYYTPWMIASSVVMGIGFGLLTTFTPETGMSKWIGFQALAGIGVGLGMQQTMIAVQTVLDIELVPIGTSVIIFLQTLGGALFASVGQNIFTNRLVQGLGDRVPSLDPHFVLSIGATSIQQKVPAELLPVVTEVYNSAIVGALYVACAMAAFSIFGSAFVEWRSVKGKKIEMAMA